MKMNLYVNNVSARKQLIKIIMMLKRKTSNILQSLDSKKINNKEQALTK